MYSVSQAVVITVVVTVVQKMSILSYLGSSECANFSTAAPMATHNQTPSCEEEDRLENASEFPQTKKEWNQKVYSAASRIEQALYKRNPGVKPGKCKICNRDLANLAHHFAGDITTTRSTRTLEGHGHEKGRIHHWYAGNFLMAHITFLIM